MADIQRDPHPTPARLDAPDLCYQTRMNAVLRAYVESRG